MGFVLVQEKSAISSQPSSALTASRPNRGTSAKSVRTATLSFCISWLKSFRRALRRLGIMLGIWDGLYQASMTNPHNFAQFTARSFGHPPSRGVGTSSEPLTVDADNAIHVDVAVIGGGCSFPAGGVVGGMIRDQGIGDSGGTIRHGADDDPPCLPPRFQPGRVFPRGAAFPGDGSVAPLSADAYWVRRDPLRARGSATVRATGAPGVRGRPLPG